mmetsp:Transcript_65114/g.146905  ORF Transcript_65114/g.146905 Transcript_65114/m.146905 type:complete len:172 (+) Transcript_65114:132-647(+)
MVKAAKSSTHSAFKMGKASKKLSKVKRNKAVAPVSGPFAESIRTGVPMVGKNKLTKLDKRMAKTQSFQTKVAQAAAQREMEKEGAFGVLSLSSALEAGTDGSVGHAGKNVAVSQSKPVRRNKAKTALAVKEVAQMSAVIAHGAFQANPLGTIREHLSNTVGGQSNPQMPRR